MRNWYLLFLLFGVIVSCNRPSAVFEVEEEKFYAPEEVQFQNKSTKADSFFWTFGDGKTSSDANPVNRYGASGNFKVSLEAFQGKKKSVTTDIIQIKPPKACLIEISTPYGNMVARLSEGTPLHRENMLKLIKRNYYDSLLFHRVVQDFMIQGGDPNSRKAAKGSTLGSGGPGYTVPAEISDSLIHTRGALAAARKGDKINPDKRSSGSQFYIVDGHEYSEEELQKVFERATIDYSPEQKIEYREKGGAPFLDGKYTVFGHLVSGYDVLDKIADVKTDSRDRPRKDIPMTIRLIK